MQLIIYLKLIFKFIHISFEEFTQEQFQSENLKNFKLNTTYSILLIISSENNLIFNNTLNNNNNLFNY